MTRRSIVIGLLLACIIGWGGEYAANRSGYEPAATHLPAVLLLPFLTLVLLPNLALQRFFPRASLLPSELIVIFSMGLAASLVPDQAMTKYLMVVITAPHYFASPENQWRELFFDYLPNWLVLHDPGATRGFYEGLAPGVPIPYGAWIGPLFWWGTLVGSLMFMGVCITVLLRKQWVEHERLRFPLGEASLHLLGVPPADGGPPFFRTRVFRIGFLVMACVMTWNILSFWKLWPPLPFMAEHRALLTLAPAFPVLTIEMNLLIFCLMFFVNREILLSIWLFVLLYNGQQGMLARLGVDSASGTIVAGGLVGIQSIAGLITFVLWGLWMARRHLKELWRKVVGKSADLDDRDELISYRKATAGLAFCLLYIVCWLYAAGLSLPVMMLFLFLLVVIYLSMARVVAEAGLVSVDLPINPHQFTIGIVGSSNISHTDLTIFGLANAFSRNWRTFTMIGPTHIAWFRHVLDRSYSPVSEKHPYRGFFMATATAFAISTVSSIGYLIWAGYTYGAQNLRTDLGSVRGVNFYGLIPSWINNATQISDMEIAFFASGVAGMVGLTAARYFLTWWPLHPIGMVVVMASPVLKALFPTFLAWLIQTLLIRFGGVGLYRRTQPLVIGMLMAYLCGQVVGLIVDLIWFPDATHPWEVY